KILHISSDYTVLNGLKHKLDEYKQEYREIEEQFKAYEIPRKYEDVHNTRLELNFLFNRISDDLVFEINAAKIFWEENKTVARAAAILELSENEEVQTKVKAKSASALRDIVGASEESKQYVQMAKISY